VGGEIGILFLYTIGIAIPSIAYFSRNVYEMLHSDIYPRGKKKVLSSLLGAFLLSIGGMYWWNSNVPQDATWINFLGFCLLPGLVIGAAVYELAFSINKLIKGT